jgi:hypothetical protein
VREPGRLAGDVGEGDRLVATVGIREDHRGSIPGDVPVDALVRDVEPLAVAVEQLPQLVRRPMLLRVRVRRVFGEFRHWKDFARAVANDGASG